MKDRAFTVLILDDEELIREAIAYFFDQTGFKTIAAGNGNEAFELIQREKIDLVISDYQMPECDGPSLLRKMRESQCKTPFIFISGGKHLNRSEYVQLGAQKFLCKPFDYDDLHLSALEILGIS